MSQWPRVFACAGLMMGISAFGCSDDSGDGADPSSGNGDGDGDASHSVGAGSGSTTSGDGDGTGGIPRTPLDPCFGELEYCVSGCQDLSSDPDNCGSCGFLCDTEEMCFSGECVFDPSSGGAGGAGGAGGSAP